MSFSSPVASTSKQDPRAPEESLDRLLVDEPKPSTSRGYGDPQPGPSTTASQYDLEVFDSGSSCSPEGTRSGDQSPDDISPGWASTSSLLSRRRTRCIARGLLGPTSRSCSKPSSTKKGADQGSSSSDSYTDNSSEEEMSVQANESSLGGIRDQDESDPDDIDIDDVDRSEASSNCERRALSRWKYIPSTSSHIQKSASTDNTDEIVQDHENYGTHVNEDSLDLPPDVSPEYAPSSSYTHPPMPNFGPLETPDRPESEDSAEDDSGLISASKRKNSDKTGHHQETEPIVKKKKKSLTPSTTSDERSDALPERSESRGGPSSSLSFTSNLNSSRDTQHMSDSSLALAQSEEPEMNPDEELEIDLQNRERDISSPSLSLTSTTSASSSPITTTFSPVEELSSSTAAIYSLSHGDEDELPPPSVEILEWVNFFAKMSHTDKMVAIEQVIQHCHPTQVRHMMTIIEPQFQRDFISLLPKELALYVLSFLEPRDLLRAAQTCRYWRILAEDNLLWREKCKEAGTSDFMEVLNVRRKKSNGLWKSGYMRQHRIEMNWRITPIRPARVLKGHDDHVITCLQFSDNRIVSGSDDNTLKVWSAITGKCLKTLVGHTGGVWSSQMDGSTVVSGSTDRTLKVWNADTGECKFTLYGHTSTVRCMHLHENTVVSGSRDATLRMWDITTGQCLHVLQGHVAAVRCVQYDGKIVVSGAYDYMVKVWNPATEECIHSLAGHTNRVYSLQFDGSHVVSGSLDTSIRVWDVETGTCKHALMGHQSLTSGMELRDNILVSGNADSTVKVWDILTGQCLQTLSGPNKHQSAVTCLQFNTKFVITSSDDGTVKLWDVKTGEFIRDLVTLESGGSGGVVWRIRANATKLVCAVGSRNGTEDTKLLVLDFDVQDEK